MLRRVLPLPLALSALVAGCAAPSASDPVAVTRTLAPFDGKSLAGWEGDGRFWRVEDGAIVGESTPTNPCERTTYLVWRAGEVADFELTVRWRLSAGNSGVQFRSAVGPELAVAGYQADLEVGPDWTGGLYEQDGRGVVTRRGERVVLTADGAKTVERFADGGALLARVRPGEWNELAVTAFGPRLTIAVNGVLFSETLDLDPAHAARRGTLALQLHQGPPMKVEFRDFALRALGAPAPLATRVEGPAAPARSAWEVEGAPQWIWPDAPVADAQRAWFRREFELARAPERADLWITCDNGFDAWLNGQGVATSDEWTEPERVDVTRYLRAGANELLVRGENEGSAAGLIAHLSVEGPSSLALDTDAGWASLLEDPAAPPPDDGLGAWLDSAEWGKTRSFGGLEAQPWRGVAAIKSDGRALDGAKVRVPEGFRVELLYSVPLERQGSWVALAAAPDGRLYASDQYGGLFRIEPPPLGSNAPCRVAPLALALGEAHGLLWAFDSLYAVVSGAGEYASGLYRAQDLDRDGELETVERLATFDGDGEHGPHAVLADPDGRSLVVVGGNHTAVPGPLVRLRLPHHWDEDALLPVIMDPGGHAVGIRAPGGWIVRTDPEGQRWELVAAGFRNSYDAAFDREGELFTYDSDMEWDVGLPWYKPTRILHVVSGAEFGWRTGSGNWPSDVYDALPPADELGLGSPTGIVFGSATSFPEPWRSALFACDWAYGRIHAVTLAPAGSSFRGTHELFASGEPFPVTDLVAGRDGALYVTTGGRQTQAGLYRISWVGDPPGVAFPARAGAAERAERRTLEAFHGRAAPEAVPLALAHLGDGDPFLRNAARVALESQEVALWREAALAETEPRRALEAMLALLHADPELPAGPVLERALEIQAQPALERGLRLDALRLIEVVLCRRETSEAERAHLAEHLDGAYPSGDPRLDRALLPLLAWLQADVSGRALDALDSADSQPQPQEERLAILYALRVLGRGWDEPPRARYLAALDAAVASVKGGASARGYAEAIRTQARERLGLAPAGAGDVVPPPPVAGLALAGRPLREWRVGDLALDATSAGRSFEGGRAAYAATSCGQCHRLAGEGMNLGPDLTGAGGRYSARDLLLAILEPSREVPDVWRDTEFWGEDELLAAGRLEQDEGDEIVVREASGTSVRVPRASVVERRLHPLSRMPDGLLAPLTEDEILDLLAYVLAGADPAADRFAR